MPWKECLVCDERLRFVLDCLKAQETMAALCRRHGVCRRVGYKWLARYKERGRDGLADQSRAPRGHPNQVEAELERAPAATAPITRPGARASCWRRWRGRYATRARTRWNCRRPARSGRCSSAPGWSCRGDVATARPGRRPALPR